MKKQFITATALAALILTLNACKGEQKAPEAAPAATDTHVKMEHNASADTLKGKNTIVYSQDLLIPQTENQTLKSAILAWENEIIGGENRSKDFLTDANAEFKSHEEHKFSVVYETEKLITLQHDCVSVAGGQREVNSHQGRTFLKEDGTTFGWNLFKTDAMHDFMKETIRTKFFQVDEAAFPDQLILTPEQKAGAFPLPKTEPWLVRAGVVFYYQENEIASFAAGTPNCTVPVAQLSEYLTPDAAKFTAE